jgi:hypothetical protein
MAVILLGLTPENASQGKNATSLPIYLFRAFSGAHSPRSRWLGDRG